MCNKTMLMMTSAISILFVAVFAKLMERLNKIAPLGYQDESGFHLGIKKN
jgi:hypothetical protein